jgi:hypothetical protein
MTGTANSNDELFDSGPLLRWERWVGLVKSGRPVATKRTLIAVLIGWVPLAIVSAVQYLISGDESAKSFFSDIAVHLYSVVQNVHEMREFPFTLRDLIGPIAVSALLPFIPLALMAMPLEVILRRAVKLLF